MDFWFAGGRLLAGDGNMTTPPPNELWDADPRKRLKAAESCTQEQRDRLKEDLANFEDEAKEGWPYGMHSAVNPIVVTLGISPGAGKRGADGKRGGYARPTCGEPFLPFDGHKKWNIRFWRQTSDLLVKFGLAFLGHDSLSDTENERKAAATLVGHLNLGTEEVGDSRAFKNAPLEPKMKSRIIRMIIQSLRPRLAIAFGYNQYRWDVDLQRLWHEAGLEIDWSKCEEKDFFYSTRQAPQRKLKYRCFEGRNADGARLAFLIWPQHPSRFPFRSDELWEQSIQEGIAFMQDRGIFTDSGLSQ